VNEFSALAFYASWYSSRCILFYQSLNLLSQTFP